MINRLFFAMLLTATLAACADNGGSSISTTASTLSGTSTTGTSGATSAPPSATTTAPASGSAGQTSASLTLQGTPAATAIVGSPYSFTPGVADGGAAVTFTATGLPTWASFDSATGTIGGTPAAADVGLSADITIVASDGSSTGSIGPFTIRVVAAAPVTPPTVADLPSISGAPATGVVAEQSYNFEPQASDPAGKPLTFSVVNLPVWATFSTSTGKLAGTPTNSQVGTYAGIVIAVNNGSSSAQLVPFSIVVSQTTPDTPVISGTPAKSVVAGQAYLFQPSAMDPYGKPLTFSIAQSPSWATFNATTGALSGTPGAAQVAAYPNIVISVTNGSLTSALPAFSIAVTAAPVVGGPTIGGTPASSALVGSSYQFTPSVTNPSGGKLTFSIQHAPVWATFNASTGELSGAPTAANIGAYANITIAVSDGTSSATLTAFSIAVTQSPTAVATLESIALSPHSISLSSGSTAQLTVTGTYSDGTTRTLASSAETFASSVGAVATVSSGGVITVAANAATGETATIGATDTASGKTTSTSESAVVTVIVPASGTAPTANSVAAAKATAENNALCGAPITPYYWEIGDKNGALVSGSRGTDSSGQPVAATTKLSIASASKFIYGTYVTQLRGAAANLTAQDINFLHFTSGYTNMVDNTPGGTCPKTLPTDTVNQCLTLTNPTTGASYSSQDSANVGKFYYNGGHMENHASQLTSLGGIVVGSLGSTMASFMGEGTSIVYTEPLMSGGMYATGNDYSLVLRHVLDGTFAMRDALGTHPVCTLPSSTCNAVSTPIKEAWHYSIGHWVEDDAQTNGDGAFSSPGAFGFYPWIESSKTFYGIIARAEPTSTGEQQGYASAQCGRLIRHAWMTGVEQTGTIPTH